MKWNANWIKPAEDTGDAAPVFGKNFTLSGELREAILTVTALGVYEAQLNGNRVGEFILAPGWTSYYSRLQYQEYDVTGLLEKDNTLTVTVGKGWYRSRMPGWQGSRWQDGLRDKPAGLLAQLTLTYLDGRQEIISTDESWKVSGSRVRFSEIYDGEIYDATYIPVLNQDVLCFEGPSDTLIPQEGEEIREQERIAGACMFTTPKGETVIDFGQNITGYVEATLEGRSGEVLDLSFAEVMDKEGNFYTDNYRSAKAQYHYTCRDGLQTYKPKLTFWGFRYIRVNQFPGGVEKVTPAHFTAIALHSDMKRTGFLSSSSPELNRLFDNIIWGQKGNFVDVPTDCPQRDERLGWTGDAQVFVRTACLNYDAEKFFTKWLADMAADQHEDGYVGHVIPDMLQNPHASAAWGDAATICPWEVYKAYGNKAILENQFECMHKWVDHITATTTTPNLWTGGTHYGDWLGLDAPSGSYKGSSDETFIASAFYAHSTDLVIRAGRVLNRDVSSYEALYDRIVAAFQETWPEYKTQTECVLAAHFRLAPDCQAAADQLARMITDCGTKLQTGFVGTPYLLHVLSDYGYAELAYSLLLREKYPSWLYPVTKGATTIWEHWDGIMENGDFWSADMNSYNHYAYGSVADWVYGVAAGITPVEEAPGYEKVRIAPIPDARLDWLKASLHTRHGLVSSLWKKADGMWRYEIITPVDAEIVIGTEVHQVTPGTYYFYSAI
ncbi:MAG: family 78 glycoside hydrolase catalytic domain [Lachnospiraceae bacterium]|nr:family 78 glycoside hydrolase catalytic domain [Lachnospiraceae bacterium]